MFPPGDLEVIYSPVVIIDMDGCIVLWYLLGVLDKARQVGWHWSKSLLLSYLTQEDMMSASAIFSNVFRKATIHPQLVGMPTECSSMQTTNRFGAALICHWYGSTLEMIALNTNQRCLWCSWYSKHQMVAGTGWLKIWKPMLYLLGQWPSSTWSFLAQVDAQWSVFKNIQNRMERGRWWKSWVSGTVSSTWLLLSWIGKLSITKTIIPC